MESGDYLITELEQNDIHKLINLRKHLYDNTEFVSIEFILWQLDDNPAGRAINLVCYDNKNEIVGEHWFIPTKYKIREKELLGSLGANALVHKDHRKKNIFIRLEKLSVEECQNKSVLFSLFVPNAFTFKALVNKLTNKDVGEIPLLIFPVNINKLVDYKFKNLFTRILVSLSVKFILLAMKLIVNKSKYSSNIVISDTDHFEESINRFWHSVKNKFDCITIRDYDYLKWRYKNLQNRKYRVLIAKSDNDIKGYLVFRITVFNGQKICVIMDYLFESSQTGLISGEMLLSRVKEESLKEDVSMICCLMIPKFQEFGALKKTGFLRVPKKFKPHPFHLVYQGHSNNIDEERTISDIENWYWTFGDYDIF
jgi:hypothetical protein